MSGHDETCRSAVEILFSMIYAEYILDGKFDVIETEVLTKLDKLVRFLLHYPSQSVLAICS
jgi:dedicator of cytokinesis protein 3